jgi:hypothetical protein
MDGPKFGIWERKNGLEAGRQYDSVVIYPFLVMPLFSSFAAFSLYIFYLFACASS